MIQAVFCPQCGAGAKVGDEQCSYCGVGFIHTNGSNPPLKINILKDMKDGIPSEIMWKMVSVFCDLEMFATDRNVQSFFMTESLKPFRHSVPQNDNVRMRVTGVVAYLSRTNRAFMNTGAWYDGNNLLLVAVIEIFASLYTTNSVTKEFLELISLLEARGFVELVG